MAILGENQKQIVYYVFDWQYHCHRKKEKNKINASMMYKRLALKFSEKVQVQEKKAEVKVKEKSKLCSIF